MTGRCVTCRHWQQKDDGDDNYRANEILYPPIGHEDLYQLDRDEASIVARGIHRVRYCKNYEGIVFYQRPAVSGAAIVDGSGYRAEFLTGEQFGCVLHEPL